MTAADAEKAAGATVRVDEKVSAFVVDVDGALAVGRAYFAPGPDEGDRIFFHTEVAPDFGRRGLGGLLVTAGLDEAREHGRVVVPVCPLFAARLRDHGEEYEAQGGRWRKPRPADLALAEVATERAKARAARPWLDETHKETYKAMVAATMAARKASRAAGISDALSELVNVRVSQINGCVACLGAHHPAARKAGVSQQKLDLLPAWREAAGVYDDVERAALAVAEHVTLIHSRPDDAALRAQIAAHLTPEQVSALEWGAILIGAFNRISILSGHPAPRPRD